MNTPNLTASALALAVSVSLGLAMAPSTSFAFDKQSAAPINVDKQGLAIKGYDPVAYFTIGAPTRGIEQFSTAHEGVVYRFADAANLKTFTANPAKFAPQYGGFCAYGVRYNKKFDGDPQQWHVAHGKLYLNVSEDVQKKWLKDVSGNNKQADINWPEIANQAPDKL